MINLRVSSKKAKPVQLHDAYHPAEIKN
jgi:hypothetical protein